MKKRLLSMLMAVLMIASLVPATALAAGVQTDAHLGHDVLTVNIKADAATKQPGIKLTYCNTCATDNNKKTDPIVSALEVTEFATADKVCKGGTHDKLGVTVLQQATCEKYGIKVTYCSKCGVAQELTDQTSALVIDKTDSKHVYNAADFTVVVAPTCTTAGYGYVKCANCGEAKFVYGGGDVNATKWTANNALTYLYMNKKATDVKTNDKTAVAAMFNATNPGHANNSKLVTATEDTYKYVWTSVNGKYGTLVKEPEYYAQVEPTHTQYVSGLYDLKEKKITEGRTIAANWEWVYKNDEWTPKFVYGVGQVGSIYCPDCGTVVNAKRTAAYGAPAGSEIPALEGKTYKGKTHTVTLDKSNIGFLPYMDGSGNKIDGKTDVYVCTICGSVGGETIPYESLFIKSFPSFDTFKSYMSRLEKLYGMSEGYGYTTADEVKVGVKAATCDTQGYTGDTYKLIGNAQDGYKWTKTTSGEYTNALGHDPKLVDSKDATCYEIGWTVNNYSVCQRKGCTWTSGTSVVKVNTVAHDWTAVDLIAPTCQSEGMTVLQCSYCKQLAAYNNKAKAYEPANADGTNIFVDYVKSVPHKAGELVNVKEATCTEKGYTGDAFCVWCNTQLVKGSETALKEHTPVNVEKVPATCTENGTEAGTKCSVCETVLSGCEVITAEGHKYVKQDDAVAATCTENGKEASEKCSVCDDVIEGKVIDALGHKYEKGVCTVCGAKDPEYVAPEFKDAASIAEYAKEAVTWAANAQVVKGDDMGNFNPTANITRQDFVTMLWRLKGEAASNQALTFTDKANIAEYAATAVAWAVENGYIKGYEDGSFAPAANITRAEIVTILDRIAGNAKAEKEATFTDVVGHWAAAEIAWAAEKGVVNGVGDNKFAPDDNAPRQDTVVMLYRFANLK